MLIVNGSRWCTQKAENNDGKTTYMSSVNVIPKYSFSFRLKCEATRSSNSLDKSLGCWYKNWIRNKLVASRSHCYHLPLPQIV